ncbi:FGGY family carbohydrate kinase [Corallincola platygyrae]|uniref:FGGY family carbohydrate kinase n=1 Tax=Corallincola platygyrae TaxID=1193278 RepID=A0ABW4XI22_9GAMM
MPLFLILDQGGQSVRALIIDQQGQVLARAQHAIATHYGDKGETEQDPSSIAQHIKQCARRATQALSVVQQQQLKSAGLVTQRASLLATHRSSGKPLTPLYSWQDRRGGALIRNSGLSTQQIREETGLRLSPHYGVAKMRWCLKHHTQVKAAASSDQLVFTPIVSYLVNQLTDSDRYLCDPINGSRTLLMQRQTAQWSSLLCDAFKIDRKWLPELTSNQGDFGSIKLAGCLKPELPLSYVSGDQAGALFSRGLPAQDTITINLGTGAFVSRLTDADDNKLLRSLIHVAEHSISALEGTVNGAASALQQVMSKHQNGKSNPASTLQQIDGTSPDIPLFINGVGGLGAPFWQPDFTSEFVAVDDKPLQPDPVNELTAVTESIAFLIQMIVQRLDGVGPKVARIDINGGLSRVNYLCQAIANLSGIEVVRQQENEGSALGCAWWLAGCPEQWRTNDAFTRFIPSEMPSLQNRFKAWQQAMKLRLPAEQASVFDSQPLQGVGLNGYGTI